MMKLKNQLGSESPLQRDSSPRSTTQLDGKVSSSPSYCGRHGILLVSFVCFLFIMASFWTLSKSQNVHSFQEEELLFPVLDQSTAVRSVDWFRRYTKVYEENMQSSSPKFVLYHDKARPGWGNRLRAFYSCTLFALLTNRIIITDEPDYMTHFQIPKTWSSQKISLYSKDFNLRKKSRLYLTKGRDETSLKKEFSSSTLEDLKTRFDKFDVIEYGEHYSFDFELLTNPRFESVFRNFFDDLSSRADIFEQVLSFILSNPHRDLLKKVEEAKKVMQWSAVDNIFALQLRSFFDSSASKKLFSDNHVAIIDESVRIFKDLLLSYDRSESFAFFFSTDDTQYHNVTCSKLEGLQIPVILSPYPPKHTSHEGSGFIKGAIVDWYLMGEASEIVTTGTSFALTARARTHGLTTGVYIVGKEVLKYEPKALSCRIPFENLSPNCGDLCL